MLKRILSLALGCALYASFACVKPVLGQSPANQPAPPPSAKEAQQIARIRRDVRNYGVAAKVTVILKDNSERYGEIASIEDDAFQIVEVDLKQLMTFNYTEVKKVRFSYGNPNPFTGKRWHPRWGPITFIALMPFILVVIPLTLRRT